MVKGVTSGKFMIKGTSYYLRFVVRVIVDSISFLVMQKVVKNSLNFGVWWKLC